MRIFWLEARPFDRVAGAEVVVRACNVGLAAPTLINGAPAFLDVLADGPTISTQVFDGAFTGRVSTTFGEIPLAAGQGDVDYWAALAWSDRPVRIWTAVVGPDDSMPAFGALQLIWDGVAEAFKPGTFKASISLRVARPSGRLANKAYTGIGGREGRQEIVGTVKPYAAGVLLNRPAVLLDAGLGLYQVHGYGSISAFTTFREGYRALDQTRVAAATAAALGAATVPATQIHTFAAEGLFRIGFQPLADITVDFDGAASGGFSARPGALIRRMLDRVGWPAGKIDTDSLAAIDAALPYDASVYDDAGVDIADALDEFCGRIGGYWDVSPLGTFYAGLVRRQAAAFTIGREGTLKTHDLFDLDQLATQAPFWRNRVGYAFNPRTFTLAELGVQIAATTADWSAIADDNGQKPDDGATRNVPRGAWAADTAYAVGDFFSYAGNSYSVLTVHTSSAGSPPPNANVELFVSGGAPGLSTARVLIFRRAASTPALPTAATTFTFATGGLTGLDNGWTLGVPTADGNPLWVSAASASSANPTDSIAAGEWAAPVVQSQDGGTGAAGINTATIYLFRRTASSTKPAPPSGTLTYTFASSGLAGSLEGWTTSLPTSGGSFRWVITATALAAAPTDSIPSAEWATASLLAQDGDNGTPGVDALQVTPLPAATAVACDPNGGPKAGQLPKTIQFVAFKNAADVTSSTAFSYGLPIGCTITDLGGGAVRVDDVTAQDAVITATGVYSGQTGRAKATLTKVRDGYAAASTTAAAAPIAGGTVVLIASRTLGVGPGGNVTVALSMVYQPIAGLGAAANQQAAQAFYRTTPGSGAWVNIGSEISGGVSSRAADIGAGEPGPTTPASITVSQSIAGPTSPANWEFAVFGRTIGGSATPEGSGTFSASFAP